MTAKIEKEFIMETGSPVTKIQPDNGILKKQKIASITRKNQNKNKNEVKSVGNIMIYSAIR